MRTRFYHTKSMDKTKKPFIQKEAYDFKNKIKRLLKLQKLLSYVKVQKIYKKK